MKKKVVVIGLDGAPFTLLKPWMEQGMLPNMAKIMQEGSFGHLKSTPEYMSPPAWTSFSTGSNPGKHGIFHFYSIDASTFKVRINNSTHRMVDPFWNQIGRAGKRVCVVNVPTTYPADKVNGCMVSGWDAPSIQSEGFTHPPELIDEILENFHDYPLVPSIKKFTISQPELAIKDLQRVLDLRISLSKYLLKKESWDMFTTVITETDQVQHFFWHLTDKTHPMFSQELSDKYGFDPDKVSMALRIENPTEIRSGIMGVNPNVRYEDITKSERACLDAKEHTRALRFPLRVTTETSEGNVFLEKLKIKKERRETGKTLNAWFCYNAHTGIVLYKTVSYGHVDNLRRDSDPVPDALIFMFLRGF